MKSINSMKIVSLIGSAIFLLFAYLLLVSNVSDGYLKYILLLSPSGLFYPIAALWEDGSLQNKKWRVIIIAFLSMLFFYADACSTITETGNGLLYDLYMTISTQMYQVCLLFFMLVANVCTLISKKVSLWITPIVLGIMLPIALATIVAIVAIIIGLFMMGSSSKRTNDNSTSSVGEQDQVNSNSSSTNKSRTYNQNYTEDKTRYYKYRITWSESEYVHKGFENVNKEILPENVSIDYIKKYLFKKYQLPVSVIVKVEKLGLAEKPRITIDV